MHLFVLFFSSQFHLSLIPFGFFFNSFSCIFMLVLEFYLDKCLNLFEQMAIRRRDLTIDIYSWLSYTFGLHYFHPYFNLHIQCLWKSFYGILNLILFYSFTCMPLFHNTCAPHVFGIIIHNCHHYTCSLI